MTVRVLKPGVLTTVQDGGRLGYRHLGVGVGGALDAVSARAANLLVGNFDDAAVLEMTLAGPVLRFERGARIALAGAHVDAWVVADRGDRDTRVELPMWRTIELPAGSDVHFGPCRNGARIYLAISGGWQVDVAMGSRSTDVRGGFGGCEGRALRPGDELAFDAREVEALRIAKWWIDPRPDLDLAEPAQVHVMAGADALAQSEAFFANAWRVSNASDRQGLRLEGPSLAAADVRERVSSPVAPGAVQLPPDGQPIVLLGEAQTVGGYPVIGHVATADLPRLSQCRAGDAVRFVAIDREQAWARMRAQAQRLERMRMAIGMRLAAW